MIINYYEILRDFGKLKTREERKQFLIETNDNFKVFLKYAFDPEIQFYVYKFPSEYVKPDTLPGIRYAGIDSELRRIYLFIKGNETADALLPQRRREIYIQILESFEPEEADLLVKMFKKDLKVNFLTYNLVKETFPNLIP